MYRFTDWGDGMMPLPDQVPGSSEFDKLVYLSGGQTSDPRAWLDTAAPGDTLANINDFMIGATYSARLFTQPNWVQPPANALTIVGNQLRAGAGYSSVYPAAYVVEIVNETTGRVTHTIVDVLSNKPANVTVSTPAALIGALDAAKAKLIAEGAGYTGYIIDVTPGINYGDIRYNLGKPSALQTAQSIIRNAAPNRVNPASRPKFEHLSVYNCRYPVMQTVLLESGPLQVSPFCTTRNRDTGDGTGTTIEFPYYVNNRARGGDLNYQPGGYATVDWTKTIDPANDFHPCHTYFRNQFTNVGGNTQFDRMDLYVGHTGLVQQGAAVGTWAVATTPAFVGPNTPTRGAGIFGGPSNPGDWVSNNIPGNPAEPAGFDFQVEVAFLTSTPVATINGGMQAKPAGGPDGNYIVAWKLDGTAASRTWTGLSLGSNASLRWKWQTTFYEVGGFPGLPIAFLVSTNSRWEHMIFSRNNISEVTSGLFNYEIVSTDHCFWTLGNSVEMFSRDAFNAEWRHSVDLFPAIWNPDRGHFHAFNFIGRAIMEENGHNQPHGDSLQYWDRTSYLGACQPYSRLIGNIQFTHGGRTGAGIQGPFFSDLGDVFNPATVSTHGYRYVSLGNFISPNEANAWAMNRLHSEFSAYDSVITVYGGAEVYTNDPAFPPARSRQRVTFGQLGPVTVGRIGSLERTSFDQVATTGNSAAVWSAPLFSFTSDVATLRSRFTGVGAAAGYGAFADSELVIDHVNRAWNPDVHEFRILNATLTGQAVGVEVATNPRQLLFGSKPKAVSVSGCRWSKGATRAAALAATPTTSPGTLTPGEWIVIWVTTSTFATTTTSGTVTVDGVMSTVSVRTGTTGPLPPPEPGLEPTILSTATLHLVTNVSTFTAVASVSVPAGGMVLALVAVDANPTVTIGGTDTDWELVGSVVRATNDFTALVYKWRNTTGSPVSKSLVLNLSTVEQWACLRYVFERATSGFAVDCQFVLDALQPAGVSVEMPELAMDANRRHLALAAAFATGNGVITTAPTGFSNIVTRPGSASSQGAGVSSCQRTGLTNNTVNPDAAVFGPTGPFVAASFGVYEVPI